MARGFMYLVAVMDWHSRKILSWRLSNTLDPGFCNQALQEAISRYGTPEIFNTDQGSQFTIDGFSRMSKQCGVHRRLVVWGTNEVASEAVSGFPEIHDLPSGYL